MCSFFCFSFKENFVLTCKTDPSASAASTLIFFYHTLTPNLDLEKVTGWWGTKLSGTQRDTWTFLTKFPVAYGKTKFHGTIWSRKLLNFGIAMHNRNFGWHCRRWNKWRDGAKSAWSQERKKKKKRWRGKKRLDF